MLKIPNCFKRNCIYFIGINQKNNDESTEINICKAFIDGIPEEISYGSNKHLTVLPNQKNNIVFKNK